MSSSFEDMSRTQLLETLQEVQARLDVERGAADSDRLIHELQVHQIELEMQNRQLRENQHLLEESRNAYTELYDFAPVIYLTLDESGRIENANVTAAQVFGVERGALIGMFLSNLVVMEDLRPLRDQLRRCIGESATVSGEYSFTTRTGRHMVVQLVTAPTGHVRSAATPVATCRAAMTDITDLKKSAERLRFVASASHALGLTFDVTQALADVVRLAVPQFADLCFADLILENGEPQRVAVAATSRESRVAASILARLRPRNNSAHLRPYDLEGTSLLVPECGPREIAEHLGFGASKRRRYSLLVTSLSLRGTYAGSITFVMIDSGRQFGQGEQHVAEDLAGRITMAIENARLYQMAQSAIRAREDTLAVVSHDLKNPLHTVRLNAELLRGAIAESDSWPGRKQVDAIVRGIEKANRLIGDLLTASTIESGHLSVDLAACGVGEILLEARDFLEPLTAEKEQHFTVELPERATRVLCDRERILQVFSNLVGNAVKFTPVGGSIDISSRCDDKQCFFSVRDNGVGIAPSALPHVFDRYWQATEGNHKGSGLGLFIAHGIVESHGGRMWVESLEGHGSTFFFTLPIALGAVSFARPRPLPEKPEHAPSPSAVLLVDDNVDAREVVGEILERKGYRVAHASNGLEALRHLKSNPLPSLILLDLKMPIMDGWQLIAELKKDPAFARLPVVLLSGSRELSSEAGTLGAVAYIPKPVKVEDLLSAVARGAALSGDHGGEG